MYFVRFPLQFVVFARVTAGKKRGGGNVSNHSGAGAVGVLPAGSCLLSLVVFCWWLARLAAWHNRLQPCAMFHTLRNVDNITCCVSVWMRLYNNQTFAVSDLSLFGTGNETHPPPDFGGIWLCYSRKNFFSKIRVKKNNNQKKSGGWKCEKFVKINFGV